MELPQTTELDELNRVLMAVTELSVQDQGCTVESVMTLCSSLALGGRPVDHRKTVRLCSFAGFLLVNKGTITLTENGKKFLELNPDHLYEFTDAQKHFVASHLILSGPWRSRARDLFLNFSPNHAEITYEFAISDNPLPMRYRSTVHLLQCLEVVLEVDETLIVAPKYVAPVAQLLADRHGTTEEELGKALLKNRRLGARAEETVLEYERERLRSLSRDAEASLVRRISQLDVGAGYDIESYDGDKPLFDYDRFIEVKASIASKLRFHWTANERRVAEKLGNRYWIYFVGNFRSNQPDRIAPIMIQNPASRLSQISQLQVEISTYVVTQCERLILKPIDQQGIKGYLL